MVVVREYVESSPDTGYYLRGRLDDQFITFQVSGTANTLLSKLEYAHGDDLDSEVFQVLYRLGLVYTHKSGVEPPGSLLELDTVSQEGVQGLEDGDREMLLSYLLEDDQFSESEKDEIRKYARERGIDLAADESNEPRSTKPEPAVGEDPPAASQKEEQSQEAENRPPEVKIDKSGVTTRFDSLSVQCEYCEGTVEAVGYINHVRQYTSPHGEAGTLPSDFTPGDASIAEWGEVDILYQDDLSKNFRYYPVCRWCGKRFYRLASFMIHLRSSRASFDADLHQRDRRKFGRPLLLPVDEYEIAVSRPRLLDEVTDVALEELESQLKDDSIEASTGKHVKRDGEVKSRSGSPNQANADVRNTKESDESQNERTQETRVFPERYEDYERSWLLTDTARFFDLLSKHAETTGTEERKLAHHHEGILEHAREVYDRTRDIEGTLEQYKSEWGAPEQGVKVPRSMLESLGIGNYRGDIFLPEGYPIPIQRISERIMHAELEQSSLIDDPESVVGDIFSDTADEPQSTEMESADSEDDRDSGSNTTIVQSGNEPLAEASASDDLIPASVIEDVLTVYRGNEDERREPSWFHASEILKRLISQETDIKLEPNDLEAESE